MQNNNLGKHVQQNGTQEKYDKKKNKIRKTKIKRQRFSFKCTYEIKNHHTHTDVILFMQRTKKKKRKTYRQEKHA